VLALVPATALAHASIVFADPSPGVLVATPPTAVTLRFSEAVTPAGPGITVLAPSGRIVTSGTAIASGASLRARFRFSGQGTYLVLWEVISADTHPARGQFTFSVGRESRPPAGADLGSDVGAVSPAGLLLQGLGGWLHLLGLALGFGTIAYRVLVLPAPGAAQDRRLDRLTTAGVALLALAEPVAIAGQAVSLGVLAPDLLASSFGRAVGLRLGGALVLWAGAGAVRDAGRGRPALLALGAGLALVDGVAGHRVTGLPDAAAFGLTAVHESAMAVWLGGLAGWLVTRRWSPMDADGSGDRPWPEAGRFGRLAAIAFGALVLSGAALALGHLRAPADLVATPYGVVLAAKVAAVAAAAAIAGVGARRLEAAALAGVLAIAALLVSLPPPR